MQALINLSYLIASATFVIGLKKMCSPVTARAGNLLSAYGMALAILLTFFSKEIVTYSYLTIAIVVGSIYGAYVAIYVPMTGMPELVALLNGYGGFSSLLISWAIYQYQLAIHLPVDYITAITMFISVWIGGFTFSGSLIAWGKLAEKLSWSGFKNQQILNILLTIIIMIEGIVFIAKIGNQTLHLYILIVLSLVFGVFFTAPIGGADMPVVIALLNSLTGIAAAAAGIAITNTILIVVGALVGASGFILTILMCKAMNRSLFNVAFSNFAASSKGSKKVTGEVKSLSVSDAYYVLESASSVVVIPGYGLAVAQAQHIVKELAALLQEKGAEVVYAIHPVAGRMPGHMNVLLAEAGIPYESLIEMDDINAKMNTVNVAMVIGANDVVNPAARDDADSKIYGMPIIEADKADNIFIFKRSMASGYAGIENPLFYNDKTSMIFGDAKTSLQGLVAEFKR